MASLATGSHVPKVQRAPIVEFARSPNRAGWPGLGSTIKCGGRPNCAPPLREGVVAHGRDPPAPFVEPPTRSPETSRSMLEPKSRCRASCVAPEGTRNRGRPRRSPMSRRSSHRQSRRAPPARRSRGTSGRPACARRPRLRVHVWHKGTLGVAWRDLALGNEETTITATGRRSRQCEPSDIGLSCNRVASASPRTRAARSARCG